MRARDLLLPISALLLSSVMFLSGCDSMEVDEPDEADELARESEAYKKDPPQLTDPVLMSNTWCEYQDTKPFVKDVKWSNAKVKLAMRALGNGWRSTFSYREWTGKDGPYALEGEDDGDDTQKRNTRTRNFMRVLCGEYRDYPAMIEKKLNAIIAGQVYASAKEMQVSTDGVCSSAAQQGLIQFCATRRYVSGTYKKYSGVKVCKKQISSTGITSYRWSVCQDNLFTAITYPAYMKMTSVMNAMHSFRQTKLNQACQTDSICRTKVGFNYNFGEAGHNCNRVQKSVAPWTHCEMKFMFEKYLTKGAPTLNSYGSGAKKPEDYEAELAQYKTTSCEANDGEYMYNFRGDKNYKSLWLESNSFIWNSRRARKLWTNKNDTEYYKRPFASRLQASRKVLASYLFYRDQDHQSLRRASEGGGGPILYITDRDADNDNLADYKLFAKDGCGDQGVAGSNPSQNCNMADWETAASTANTTGHTPSWKPEYFSTADMGFLKAFPSFEQRMARFNQALDRHTNWGPTGFYMQDAAPINAKPTQIPFIGAYSPIVACSYDISASHNFATGSFGNSDPFEDGMTKWMFIMRFPTKNYYSEADMAAGKAINFIDNYFNETSLSNDYYRERALDRFGFVPVDDIHASIYFAYGNRGVEAPDPADIPAPPAL